MAQTALLAGAARRTITPRLADGPVFLAGFGGNRRATGVHLELFARALALRCADQTLLWVVCDVIGLGWPVVQEIRAMLDAQVDRPFELVVACTHTHSGPDTIGLWGPSSSESG